jgi:hypothetical protein
MKSDYSLTADEVNVLGNQDFFRQKAVISAKIKRTLELLHHRLKPEVVKHTLLAPDGFDPEAVQLVKGEHLEECPYQYLDFPRYYTRQDKLAFRSLFWWGHHLVFALIVEGPLVKNYRMNLFNRFSEVANHQLSLSEFIIMGMESRIRIHFGHHSQPSIRNRGSVGPPDIF